MTKLCGIIDLLKNGDYLIADKGFALQNVLNGTGIEVNNPPVVISNGQFTAQEEEKTQTMA